INMKVPNGSAKARGRQPGEARKAKKTKKQLLNHRAGTLSSDNCTASPSTALARKYQQLGSQREPSLKRLKSGPRKLGSLQGREARFSSWAVSHAHSNGGVEDETQLEMSSEETRAWSSFALSVLRNDTERPFSLQPDGKDEEPPQYHAERDPVHNRTLLVLHQGQRLCFRGTCLLTCLYGRVEVLGFTIEEGQQPYPIFSPATICPLTITAMKTSSASTKSRKERRLEAKAVIRKYLSIEPRKRLQSKVNSESSLVLLESLETPLTRFLSSLPEYHDLFALTSRELKLQSAAVNCPLSAIGLTPLRGSGHGLVTSQSYRNALTTLVNACAGESDGCPIILVCGAKNTGKSTFNRHLINTLLNHTSSVDYLECDLGQTEFTPPGCLSLCTVTKPLLGAPFTHQHTPQHMVFFGESSCERDLDRYLESLKFLWRSYTRETAIIINTMGWVKGFGFQLLVDLIRLFSVTHVVQLSHGDTTQCPALTSIFLQSAHGWQTRPPAPPSLGQEMEEPFGPQGHVLISVHSEFEGAGTTNNLRYHRSNIIRDMALLGYFSQLQTSGPGPVRPLHCFNPYQVPISAVALRVTHSEVAPAHVLYVANGNLVALCCLGEKVAGTGGPVLLSQTPICKCVGFGVLRGVDMTRGLLFLVTPVVPSVLRQVNCLLLGGIALPHNLLKAQPGVQGEKPYITSDYSFELSGAGKMKVYKGLQRPELLRGATR
uniref:Polynucleotide 5'-hydroxyl-kinase NOL9 n=1 Tax=Scleropages formosus TaxID=113540 RepID=A0A8C9SG77_SCLFO